MKKEGLIKAAIMFGGGFLLFMLLKPKKGSATKSFDSKETPRPLQLSEQDKENAEIVANAYRDAMANNEPASRLTELNKELTKEFGMRCYIDKSGSLVVCDVSGNTILKK